MRLKKPGLLGFFFWPMRQEGGLAFPSKQTDRNNAGRFRDISRNAADIEQEPLETAPPVADRMDAVMPANREMSLPF